MHRPPTIDIRRQLEKRGEGWEGAPVRFQFLSSSHKNCLFVFRASRVDRLSPASEFFSPASTRTSQLHWLICVIYRISPKRLAMHISCVNLLLSSDNEILRTIKAISDFWYHYFSGSSFLMLIGEINEHHRDALNSRKERLIKFIVAWETKFIQCRMLKTCDSKL